MPPHTLQFSSTANRVSRKIVQDYVEKSEEFLPKRIEDVDSAFKVISRNSKEEKDTPGMKNLRRIMDLLEHLRVNGFTIAESQYRFVETMLKANLPNIMGDDFHLHLDFLKKHFELTEKISLWGIIISPRRYGKTTAAALMIAVLLAALGGFEVYIYSTGRRASRKLLVLIYVMLERIYGGKPPVISFNVETLSVTSLTGKESKVHSLPSNSTVSVYSFRLCQFYFIFERRREIIIIG